jgi:hypothetical protein
LALGKNAASGYRVGRKRLGYDKVRQECDISNLIRVDAPISLDLYALNGGRDGMNFDDCVRACFTARRVGHSTS